MNLAGLDIRDGITAVAVGKDILPLVTAGPEWNRATKVAKLREVDGVLRLRPLIYTEHPHTVDAEAECLTVRHPTGGRPPHRVPGLNCTCGFHGMHPTDVGGKEVAAEMRGRSSGVVLDVDLGGYRIEGDRGWRAQYQRILRVHVPAVCRYRLPRAQPIDEEVAAWCGIYGTATARCGRQAVECAGVHVRYSQGHTAIVPVCAAHVDLRNDASRWPLARIANELGTEVGWWDHPAGTYPKENT